MIQAGKSPDIQTNLKNGVAMLFMYFIHTFSRLRNASCRCAHFSILQMVYLKVIIFFSTTILTQSYKQKYTYIEIITNIFIYTVRTNANGQRYWKVGEGGFFLMIRGDYINNSTAIGIQRDSREKKYMRVRGTFAHKFLGSTNIFMIALFAFVGDFIIFGIGAGYND